MEFDKRQTNIAKGIALCMLLWHHLFYNVPEQYKLFTSLYITANSIPVESFIADFCKICVSIFLFLSGYGLYKSWTSYKHEHSVNGNLKLGKQFVFVRNHLLKLMGEYWFIFIIFVPIGFFLGKFSYIPSWHTIVYYTVDFFGLANLFQTSTFNPTWWFMSTIIVYYLIFPLLMKLNDYSPEILLAISIFLALIPFIYHFPFYIRDILQYLLSFISGIYFANYNLLRRTNAHLNTYPKKIIIPLLFFVSFLIIRLNIINQQYYLDILGAIPIVLLSYMLISKIKFLDKILKEIGKVSGKIFMFHTFINGIYFRDFAYSPKYSILIFLFLLILYYLIAKVLEFLQNITGYNKLLHLCLYGKKQKQP
ncbi:MAG: acyltransferase [Clostridia bacterium]|nr:acyltransferase [Clostridia bacterium]